MKSFYTVRTRDGITFHLEAANFKEAQQRASSPQISRHIALMIQEALSHVVSVEPHRGPKHTMRAVMFDNEFFNK